MLADDRQGYSEAFRKVHKTHLHLHRSVPDEGGGRPARRGRLDQVRPEDRSVQPQGRLLRPHRSALPRRRRVDRRARDV